MVDSEKKTICLISFNEFSKLLPAFTYARAIGNLWIICLQVNILSPVRSFIEVDNILPVLSVSFRSLDYSDSLSFENIPVSDGLNTTFLPLGSAIAFLVTSSFTF